MANKAVRFGRATTGTDYALMEDGPTAEGQPTIVPQHSIYGYLPDTVTADLANMHSGIDAVLAKILAAPATGANQSTQITAEQAIQAQIGATITPATGTSNKLLTDILTKYGIGLPSAFGSGGGIKVDIVSGAGSGGTAAADDADFTAGVTNGTPVMGIFENSPTSVTDGDLGTVGITVTRRIKASATIDTAIPAGTNNIGDVDVLTCALPTGAATSANQSTQITAEQAILAKIIPAPATAALQGAGLPAALGTNGGVKVDALSCVLPTGAATSVNQALGLTTTITEYNITLTANNTQYTQALPATCKGFEFVSRGGYPVRWSLVTGKVAAPTAPYNILKAGSGYDISGLNLASATIYFATAANAGDVVELITRS